MSYRNIDEWHLTSKCRFTIFSRFIWDPFADSGVHGCGLVRYLQSPGWLLSCILCLRQKQALQQNFLSGLLLSCGPVILNGLLLFAVSKPPCALLATLPTGLRQKPRSMYLHMGNRQLDADLPVDHRRSLQRSCVHRDRDRKQHRSSFSFLLLHLFDPDPLCCISCLLSAVPVRLDLSGDWVDVGLSISPYTSVLQGAGVFQHL